MSLALRFNWTPREIAELDPDYVEELQARLLAESHLQPKSPKPAAPEDDD